MSKNEKNKSPRRMADKKWFIVMAAATVCFAFAGSARAAWLEKQKLLASDGAAEDYFGSSVSISGDYAIVGAYGSYGSNNSAYIFKRNGETWSQQQKLAASDSAAGDYFGNSVSISGDYAIVGAHGDDEDERGSHTGSAYIFRWDGTSWVQQAKLLASDGATWGFFGYSVSISGDYAIVGAGCDDDKGDNSGSAYIFKRDGTSWVQRQKLTASDGDANDYFGWSVSISGDYAIVGAHYADGNVTISGSAYIFKREGESWSEQQKLLASDGGALDEFGYSVSITSATAGAASGDYAIVGTYVIDSAYIFKRDGTSWSQQAKLVASDGAAGDYFGYSVSISGDYAIVGTSGIGSAYIFNREGETWSQQAKILASDGAAGDLFGRSVSISGDLAIVGAFGDDDKGDRSGSAYIFIDCSDWLTADLNKDCFVDLADFAIMAAQWLQGN